MTRLGRSIILTGELTSEEDVEIEGQVHGRVSLRNSTLTILEHGLVDAEIRGVKVLVRGRLMGSVASKRIEIHASAEVAGNLSANQIVVADGARFDGHIDMDQRTITAKVAAFKTAKGAAE